MCGGLPHSPAIEGFSLNLTEMQNSVLVSIKRIYKILKIETFQQPQHLKPRYHILEMLIITCGTIR